MRQWLKTKIWHFLYDSTMMRMHTELVVSRMKEIILHDLCSRVSIKTMRQILTKAEKSDQKYITLAKLLEGNYNK